MPEPEETPLEVEEIEESPVEPTADTEATVTDVVEDSTTVPAESPQDFDWSGYENADRFKGRSVQEVINYLNHRDHQYGTQTRELGDLRSYREQNETRMRQTTGQPAPAKKPTFSEGQKFEFAQKFQDDPLGAVSEYMGPQLADQLTQQVFERVNQGLGPALQNQAQYVATQTEYAACVRNHPEIETDQELRWTTHELMGPDYLGGNVPFDQAMFLAKLSKEEPSLYSNTFLLMRRGVSFDEAKSYAELKHNAPANAETKKQQLKDEVAGIRRGTKTSTKGTGTPEPKIETMDDAFAVD